MPIWRKSSLLQIWGYKRAMTRADEKEAVMGMKTE